MKKLFTLMAAALLMAANAQAQTDTPQFMFSDKDGNTFEDGATININSIEIITESDGFQFVQMPSGLYLKETQGAGGHCLVQYRADRIDNGALQICFPVNCISIEAPGAFQSTAHTPMAANEIRDLQTEWLPEDIGTYGEAIMTLNIKIVNAFGVAQGNGPTIHLHYTYDANSSGINTATAAPAETARYTIGGQQLAAPQRGINIVRMSDGTSRKVQVK